MTYKIRKAALMILLLIILAQIAIAPPSTKTVRGTVYARDGITQAKLGTNVFINDTNSSVTTTTKTSGPPSQTGRYSATLLSTTGDIMEVIAYNETNWGNATGIMASSQVVIDVTLNRNRTSEAKVVIKYPRNNTMVDTLQEFNVTANITILGANGVNCNATLSFSNYSVFPLLTGTYTLNLGNRVRGVPMIVKWNISARDGLTNITVLSKCSSDGKLLENLNRFIVYNVTGRDKIAPVLRAKYPRNNTRINNPLLFLYNVSDISSIYNCSLIQSNITTNETLNPQKNHTINFTYFSASKYINWSIKCIDDTLARNSVIIGRFNLSVNSLPYLTSTVIENPINLIAGSNKTVFCNGTATDPDSYLDIDNINSSIYFEGLSENDALNRSNHYRNTSCTLFGGAGINLNYRCSFKIEYYANNGTWFCNNTVIDIINSTNTTEQATEMNELLAIGVSPSVINFGALQILQISPDDIVVNVTNFGNIPLDLKLTAYALMTDDNISMDCTSRNISMDYERWSLISGQFFDSMMSVNNTQNVMTTQMNLRRKGYGDTVDSVDQVYWKLQIPMGVQGRCNGKVLFSALANQ